MSICVRDWAKKLAMPADLQMLDGQSGSLYDWLPEELGQQIIFQETTY